MLLSILQEGLTKSCITVLILAAVLIPIMILFEYAAHYRLLEKSARYFNWLARLLTISPGAAFPLLIGIFFGILFGAAVLMEFTRQKLLTKRDLILVGTFLALNHGVVEDNLIFTALGANFPALVLSRFTLALIVTRTAAFLLDRFKPPLIMADASAQEKE